VLDPTHLAAFRGRFRGEVILPGDAAYDQSRRVWNAMIERQPAIVARPTDPSDVMNVIRFGRDEDLLIAVRGGGHSMPGHGTCDGGMVIDLSRMRGAAVDPRRAIAHVKGGALLGELDAAAQAVGLVCPVGVVSHTGVGGLTLGGGMGRLQRKLGFTIDNLRAVELVTADGRLVRADGGENPDLFWAIRGAGANFGVVTSFEFGLQPYDGTITVASAIHPATRIREAWALFREFAISAPDHVGLTFNMVLGTAERAVPDELVGEPVAIVGAYHSGDPARAEQELAPLMEVGPPAVKSLVSRSYLELQSSLDDPNAWGHRVYTKGGFTDDLPAEALDRLVEHVATGTASDAFGLWAQGGAISRVADDETAFTGRNARFQMSSDSTWDDPSVDESRVAWARRAFAIVEPHSLTGRYVNDVADSGADLGRWIYGDAKYERLVTVKRAWDPDNVFRLNQNIEPWPVRATEG
jgi:FAD/FMN-containing dehydrogenase